MPWEESFPAKGAFVFYAKISRDCLAILYAANQKINSNYENILSLAKKNFYCKLIRRRQSGTTGGEIVCEKNLFISLEVMLLWLL